MRVSRLSAGLVLVLMACGLLLYFAHVAFIPIALALLFALVLSGPVEVLHKHRVPRSVSAFVILAIALGILSVAMMLLWKPAQNLYAQAPTTIRTVKQKFEPVTKVMSRVDALGNAAGSIATSTSVRPGARIPAATVVPASSAGFLGSSLAAVGSSLTFVILTLFLLTGGPPMLARMAAAFASDLNASRVLTIIEAVRKEVGRFYAVTALINLGLGTLTALAMWQWGMPTPYVWGIVAAFLNFIPYAGPTTTLVIITFVASMTFPHPTRILAVGGTFLLFALIEGQIIQPLFVGRRLQINPLLIFLGLWLGGLFWGIAGVLLATPVLVALKVIAENVSNGRAALEFLGPNHETAAADRPLRSLVSAVGGRRRGDGRRKTDRRPEDALREVRT